MVTLAEITEQFRNRVSDKVQIYNNSSYGDVLSPFGTIQQNYEISQSFTEDNNLLQIAFSPQDEINDDIINEFDLWVAQPVNLLLEIIP